MSTNGSTLVPVLDANRCIGHLLRRGPAGVEAFDAGERSIGVFQNDHDAAAAIWRRARGQEGPAQ